MAELNSPSRPAAPPLTHTHALFLDFDGTLAPLQDNPDTVALPAQGAECLLKLSDRLGGALVLISGRGLHDLAMRTPIQLWRAGGHGVDIAPPGTSPSDKIGQAPPELITEVARLISAEHGVRLENKGRVLAIHYRQNPAAGPSLYESLSTLAAQFETYHCQHGKMVIELKPSGTDKGSALISLMQRLPFKGRIPVMVGDDTTDEDAIVAAIGLGGIGVKVGAGETQAQYRLADTTAVWDWLERTFDEHA